VQNGVGNRLAPSLVCLDGEMAMKGKGGITEYGGYIRVAHWKRG
jgi:hypothetical protein